MRRLAAVTVVGALALVAAPTGTATAQASLVDDLTTRVISEEIEIAAPASRVWEILTDFAAYPEWNPFITRIEGRPAVGERLTVTIHPPGFIPITVMPTVLAADPERELRWLGELVAPNLFDGEHSFHIQPLAGDRVRFVQRERFDGLLVPLSGTIIEQSRQGFVAMNDALARRAEGSDAPGDGH